METQQLFGQRLGDLLEEKGISQADFAEAVGCSRQSVNFYILGKRSPDIALAAIMAKELGVSCDYLIGFSDFRGDLEASMTVKQAGLTEETAKFFAGLRLMTDGAGMPESKEYAARIGLDYEADMLARQKKSAEETLRLLNALISDDRFGGLLQYIKRYGDICGGSDELMSLSELLLKLESPETGAVYGSEQEKREMMSEFCLHAASRYFEEIVKGIA